MGQATIIKEGATADEKLTKQSLASAKGKTVLADARTIDMDDPFHETNQPRLVDTTSKNIPTDLSWGIREVFFKASGTAVLSITGTNKSGIASVWFTTVTKSGSSVTYGEWSSLNAPVAFTGATQKANGVQGLVPKPLAADYDMVLMANGSWGLPDSIVNRINLLQDKVNDIITALNGSIAAITGVSSVSIATLDELDDETRETIKKAHASIKTESIGPDGLPFTAVEDVATGETFQMEESTVETETTEAVEPTEEES